MEKTPSDCAGSICNVVMGKTRIFRVCDEYRCGIMPFTGYHLYHVQIRIVLKWNTIATYRKIEDALNIVTTLMKSQL